MKWRMFLIIYIVFMSRCNVQELPQYIFSYFKGNGEDGLHLAASTDGFSWTALNNDSSFLIPAAGNDKLMRDPCIIHGPDKKFHMVWTVSWGEKGIGYASSVDLMNWSEQQYIPVMEHEENALNCWAPELFYDDDGKYYMIYWSTTIPGRFPETDSTGDGNYNHRLYYVTTTDFVNYSDTRLLYDPAFNVIDATIIKHDDEYIMFLKNETKRPQPEKNIRIARSRKLTEGWGPAGDPVTVNWVEGPTVLRKGNDWIVYFDMYRQHRMGAVMSHDLEHWTDITGRLSFPDGTKHGTVLEVDTKTVSRLKRMHEK